jgi:TatD DNase family protein
MIDIGVNFHSSQLKGKSDDLISKAKQAGLTGILATGTSLPSSQLAQGLAKRQPGYVWATAGVHPHSAKEWSSAVEAGLEALWKSTAVVAVGEAGLDYNRNTRSSVSSMALSVPASPSFCTVVMHSKTSAQ